MRHGACSSSSPRRYASPVLLAALALGVGGCPDIIADPDAFYSATLTDSPTDSPVVNNCPLGPTYVEDTLLPNKCALNGCHSATSPQNGLNLAGTDSQLATRLVGVQGSSSCGHTLWIDPGNPAQSLVVAKVTTTPPCGSRMPIGTPLSAMEIQCLTSWAQVLAASTVGGMDAGTDAGNIDASGMTQ